jgi:putative glycosyl hydrolase
MSLLLAALLFAADSTEAAKVAQSVRAAAAVDADHSHFNALGALSTTHIGAAIPFIRANGPAAFYASSSQLSQAVATLQNRTTSYLAPLAQGGIHWYRDVQNIPWGMVEVARGNFDFDLIDALVRAAQTAGGRYVGTVMPYAGWELKAAGYAATTDAQCQRLMSEDVYYLAFDQRMDRYKDEAEYLAFLSRVVERYDGDGIDDMPGLITPILYWQIHNEPEGDHCGLFRGDVAAFVRLMSVSANAIRSSCPACKVLNGGAATPLYLENSANPPNGVTFWRDFAAAGGAASVDVVAVHYNDGKSPGHGSIADFEEQIRRARELLGQSKPVWITEFGTVIGDHGNFTGLSEAEAAAWFVRFYTAGLAAGAEKFFSDAPAFVDTDGTVLLPYYVNKLVEMKVGGFTSAARIAAGQYRFRSAAGDVYVLWSGVPSALSGPVVATDIYGNDRTVNASQLAPTETAPLFVAAASTARRRAVKH